VPQAPGTGRLRPTASTSAEAWDIHHLREAGCQSVARFVALIGDLATRALGGVRSGNLEPKSWEDVLSTVTILGQVVPPESILRVAEAGPPSGY
jgi:hypothetical protein